MERTKIAYRGRVVLWIGMYVVLILAPLVVAVIGHDRPSRGFWIEFGVGLGFVGLAMMGLQFVLTARLRHIAAPFGTDAMLQFHRQAGLGAYVFILGHAVVLLLAAPQYLAFLDPRVNAPRAVALGAAVVILTLLIVFTLWRTRFRLTYEWWRLTHGIFALLVVFIGLAHVMMVGFYVSAPWQRALWVGLTLGAMGLLIHARVIKPMLMSRRPYRVVDVRPEVERVWTLELAPEGHDGMRFEPGQFAWLTLGPSPFVLEQHPFTMASSAERPGTYLFTIKELGDFSATIKQVKSGTRAFLEGPYGAFTLDPDPAVGAVFIVGGIGVTPVMSMLRTLADRRDQRPLVLLYGNARWEKIAFREELEALQRQLNLKVVHVLEEPPPDWEGEAGYVTPEILERHCPPRRGDGEPMHEYFICGPDPMMDAVELTLRRWGAPMRKVNSERFKIV